MVCLLRRSALCVSHFQTILDATQVSISKQLRYLRRLGLVEKAIYRNFRVYRLRSDLSRETNTMLAALDQAAAGLDLFKADLARLDSMAGEVSAIVSKSMGSGRQPESHPESVIAEPRPLPGLSAGVEYVD